jgi:hypothetical protein
MRELTERSIAALAYGSLTAGMLHYACWFRLVRLKES